VKRDFTYLINYCALTFPRVSFLSQMLLNSQMMGIHVEMDPYGTMIYRFRCTFSGCRARGLYELSLRRRRRTLLRNKDVYGGKRVSARVVCFSVGSWISACSRRFLCSSRSQWSASGKFRKTPRSPSQLLK